MTYYANDRSYSLAMTLHIFAEIWYSDDNIRKITHGLSQVTNLPIVVLWCFDRLLSLWIYRYLHRRIVCKEGIGGEGGEEGKKHGDPGRKRNSANQWAK